MKKETELNYGRHIIKNFIKNYDNNESTIKILDIGCGAGEDLELAKIIYKNKNVDLYGIEINHNYLEISQKKGIKVYNINIENEKLPFNEEYFDIVIINQVLEHTKEIFFITSQINRILKKNGLLIIGVPNLAAFHNRILLLLGRQPACIKTLSAHVRGFTKKDLISFFKLNGFSLIKFAGSNFYPLPKKIAKLLSNLLPSFSVCIFAAFKKNGKSINDEYLNNLNLETNFKI